MSGGENSSRVSLADVAGGTCEPAGQSPLFVVECFVVMLAVIYLIAGPVVQLSEWHCIANENPGVLEADAWRHGRLALRDRIFDTALYRGHAYNVYPPLFTMFSLAATTVGEWHGLSPDAIYPPWYVLFITAPLPFVGFWAFQQVLRRAEWSAAFTALWVLGTPILPSLVACKGSSITSANQVLSNVGLMLIAGDLLGKRRMWPAALGLVVAGWTRQTTMCYGIAALLVAWRYRATAPGGLVKIGVAWAVAAAVLLTLSYLKFDHPLDNGYQYLYAGNRETGVWGRRAGEFGIFSRHYLAENAADMNLALPRFRFSHEFLRNDNDNQGVSIWITCPILLGAVLGIGRWWRYQPARVLMLSSILVMTVILLYHSPGSPQVGYFRYALDFIPVWMLVIAPFMITGWRRHATVACMIWSAWYFHMICT